MNPLPNLLDKADFPQTILTQLAFLFTNFTDANLTGANLSAANPMSTDLSGTNLWSKIIMPNGKTLKKIVISPAILLYWMMINKS